MTTANNKLAVVGIHQIEITSRCNLRCKYCTHPKMPRPKEDMTRATYVRTLDMVKALMRQGYPQRELNLAGIGESTMHPEFVDFMFLAREAVGRDVDLILATNGLLMTPEMARAIAPTNPRVWVSLHRPERAQGAVEALKAAGILSGVSIDPAVSSVDWAGQVEWQVSTPVKGSRCPWLSNQMAFVMSNGDMSRCCFDATGDGVFGSVWDDADELFTGTYSLCQACHFDSQVAA